MSRRHRFPFSRPEQFTRPPPVEVTPPRSVSGGTETGNQDEGGDGRNGVDRTSSSGLREEGVPVALFVPRQGPQPVTPRVTVLVETRPDTPRRVRRKPPHARRRLSRRGRRPVRGRPWTTMEKVPPEDVLGTGRLPPGRNRDSEDTRGRVRGPTGSLGVERRSTCKCRSSGSRSRKTSVSRGSTGWSTICGSGGPSYSGSTRTTPVVHSHGSRDGSPVGILGPKDLSSYPRGRTLDTGPLRGL